MAERSQPRTSRPADTAANPAETLLCRRLLRGGSAGLGDAELLALLLGIRGDVAQRLLRRLGGLRGLLTAPATRVLEEPGVGSARAGRLRAALALVERGALEGLADLPVLSCTTSVRRFLRNRLAAAAREEFGCVFLDARHRLICFETLFLGTVDRAQVHPREILRRSLELNAAAVILTHNHPSGIAEPSSSDIRLTRELVDLLGKLEIRVLDHLIVGRGAEVSLAERGLL